MNVRNLAVVFVCCGGMANLNLMRPLPTTDTPNRKVLMRATEDFLDNPQPIIPALEREILQHEFPYKDCFAYIYEET